MKRQTSITRVITAQKKPTILEDIHWYPKVKTGPEDPIFSPFDMSPIRPRDVTSPSLDGVPFGILYHLPNTHHVTATLFNKVLATNSVPTQ